jgi:transcriptional regulator of acetoin/glycerol metabolism
LDEAAIERALSTHGLRESPEGLAAEAFELRDALARHDWNKVHVAQELGVHLATVYRRIKKHRIAAPGGRATTPPDGSTHATAN